MPPCFKTSLISTPTTQDRTMKLSVLQSHIPSHDVSYLTQRYVCCQSIISLLMGDVSRLVTYSRFKTPLTSTSNTQDADKVAAADLGCPFTIGPLLLWSYINIIRGSGPNVPGLTGLFEPSALVYGPQQYGKKMYKGLDIDRQDFPAVINDEEFKSFGEASTFMYRDDLEEGQSKNTEVSTTAAEAFSSSDTLSAHSSSPTS